MMKVLVVEDEEMIRKGIVLAVDWAVCGRRETTPLSSYSPPTTASLTPKAPCAWEQWTFFSSRFMMENWNKPCRLCAAVWSHPRGSRPSRG